MTHSVDHMVGFTIRATDGDVGKIDEFYFDDETWTIRYMVAETGNWLSDRKVLISLAALGKPDWESHTFTVNLTCEQVRNSPDIDTKLPIFRQHEAALHAYYNWPLYWEGGYGGTFGISTFPLLEKPPLPALDSTVPPEDQHLRSTKQVTGYHIHATDGDIGHVDDFIVDEKQWGVRYLVVETGAWFTHKKVLIAPLWITKVNWADASVYLDRTREAVRNSPELEFAKTIDRFSE